MELLHILNAENVELYKVTWYTVNVIVNGKSGVMEENMKEYKYVTLRQRPELKDRVAEWFHCKWGVPQEAYIECMEAYLNNETKYGWYL